MSNIIFIQLWTSRLLKAETDYVQMYKQLANEKPVRSGLADWRCSVEYKRLLKKRSTPIRKRIKRARIMLKELL